MAVGVYLSHRDTLNSIFGKRIESITLFIDKKALSLAVTNTRTDNPFTRQYLRFLVQELKT